MELWLILSTDWATSDLDNFGRFMNCIDINFGNWFIGEKALRKSGCSWRGLVK